jgi:hypothetical protein
MPTDESAVRRIVESLLSDSGFRARFNVGGFSAADKDTLVTTAEQVAQLMGDKSIQASIGNALWLDGASIINGTITAPKIEVTSLSAIVVNTGALTVSDTVTIGAGGKITDADGSYWDQSGIILQSPDLSSDALIFRRTPTGTHTAQGSIVVTILNGNADVQIYGDSNSSAYAVISVTGDASTTASNIVQAQAFTTGGAEGARFRLSADGNIYLAYGASTTKVLEVASNYLTFPNIPTSNPGGSGRVWSNSGVLTIT